MKGHASYGITGTVLKSAEHQEVNGYVIHVKQARKPQPVEKERRNLIRHFTNAVSKH